MFGLHIGVGLMRRIPHIAPLRSSLGWISAGRFYHSQLSVTSPTRTRLMPPAALHSQFTPDSSNGHSRFSPGLHHQEYILPSSVKRLGSSIKILDPSAPKVVELPPLFQNKLEIVVPSVESVQKVIKDPPLVQNSIGGVIIEKHAKNVLKYRRRHMNRHKLKKLRKRMKFLYIKLSQRRAKRRERAMKQMQEEIIQAAHDWDPRKEAEDFLGRARKGGFRVDIFSTGLSKDSLPDSK